MKKIIYTLPMLWMALMLAVACEKQEEPEVLPIISLSNTMMEIEAVGGEFVLEYTIENPVKDAVIKASPVEDWVENIDCSEAGKVKFSVSANTQPDTRNSGVDLVYEYGNGKSVQARFNVRQKGNSGKTEISFKQRQMDVPHKGGNFVAEYVVMNPVEGAKVTAVASKEWIGGLDCSEAGKIKFSVPQFLEMDNRSSSIDVRYEYADGKYAEARFSVVQSGVNSEIVFAQKQVDMPFEGGEYTLEYNVNDPVDGAKITVVAAEDWVQEIDYSQFGKITFTIPENLESGSRSSVVDLIYEFGEGLSIKARFKVVQQGVEYIDQFKFFRIVYEGDMRGDGSYVYIVEILDKELNNGFLAADTRQMFLAFVSDKTPDVPNPDKPVPTDKIVIPDGEYKVANAGKNTIWAEKSFMRKVDGSGMGYVIQSFPEEGTVSVKNHGGEIEVSGRITDNEDRIWNMKYTGAPTHQEDDRFISTLTGDVDVDLEGAVPSAFYVGLVAETNTTCWVLQIPTLKQEIVQVEIYAPAGQTFDKGFPTGEFLPSKDGSENTFLSGAIVNNNLIGSWYSNLTEQGYVKDPKGPLTNGKVTISKSGDDYTVTLDTTDDIGYKVTGTWTGPLSPQDVSKNNVAARNIRAKELPEGNIRNVETVRLLNSK